MIQRAQTLLRRAKESALARNSGWMFLGYGMRIVVQAAYFILIARALGPEQYGAFVGVVALVALVAPYVSLGGGNLLVKNVSRDKSVFAEYWGNALFLIAVSGAALLGVVLSTAHFLLPHSIPWKLILLVCVADLIAVRGSEVGGQCFQATDQLRHTATLTLLPAILRLAGAAIVFTVWGHASALVWGWFYMGAAVISGLVAVAMTRMKLGAPRLALGRIPRELTEGFYFGTSLCAQTVYNDIDKTMLARLSTLEATGIYGAAYRIIDVSFTPVRSVLNAAYTNFFRHGKSGIASTFSYARKLLPKMMGYSAFVCVAVFVAAPLVPYILGAEYARTVEALRWLALLPFFKSMHYFLADSLTGAGHQGVRTAGQIGVALFNIGLNIWLIPAYSWRGAAWASLASDGALVLVMYVAVMVILGKEARARAETAQAAMV
ncbi:MAG TPA: oligosaccharide flippase family protein [Verrucomicrobiae bacterium]|nr:oligosaccharide flippase family protein [Verrucomicrobiae bacterium]